MHHRQATLYIQQFEACEIHFIKKEPSKKKEDMELQIQKKQKNRKINCQSQLSALFLILYNVPFWTIFFNLIMVFKITLTKKIIK